MPANENPGAAGTRQPGRIRNLDAQEYTESAPSEQAPATPYEGALAAIARGIPVFPCEPGTKIPAVDGWQQKATTDPDEIYAFWHCPVLGIELPRNPATPTGNGRQVVDLDVKEGRNGPANFASLADIYDWNPKTYRTRTPSGGEHLWFRVEGKYRNSEGRLGTGIDTRGDGGLVLLPGALNDEGTPYVLLDDAPEAPLHPKIVARLIPYEAPPERKPEILTDLDDPYAVGRAIEYLQRVAPIPTEGGTGNSMGYRVAAELKKYGVSRETALSIMTEHWNTRHDFPREPGELESIVNNGFDYGRGAVGELDARQQFEPVSDEQQAPQDVDAIELPEISADYGYQVVDFEDDDDFSAIRDPLVTGFIDQQTVGIVYGKSHTGKSFVLMRMAWHIAAGEPWAGQFLTQGPVLYVSTEGGEGVRLRKAALRKTLGKRPLPLRFVSLNISLGSGGEKAVKRVIREARLLERKVGRMPILIVIDTMSATMMNVDINQGGDVSAIINRLRQISIVTGAACIGVGHTGKNEDNGPLGSYLFTANCDSQIQVRVGEIEVQKKRDGMKAPLLGFALDHVDLGHTATGQPLNSAVARILDRPQTNLVATERELRKETREALELLRSLAKDLDRSMNVVGLSLKSLAKEAMTRGMRDGKSEKSVEDSMRKALKRLAELGLAKVNCGLWLPIETTTIEKGMTT